MIPFFVGYALLVWFLTARYRRTPWGFAVCSIGVGILVALSYFHWRLGHANPDLMTQGMQILMYPYIVVVGAVGFFIASIRHRPQPGTCPGCGYDMHGLGFPVDRCPECGHACEPIRFVYRASGVARTDLRSSDVEVLAPPGPEPGAGEQDDARHHPQKHPA